MSESERTQPPSDGEPMKSIASLVDDVSSSIYDVHSWAREGDIDQAMAALEETRSTLFDIQEWLETLASEKDEASHG